MFRCLLDKSAGAETWDIHEFIPYTGNLEAEEESSDDEGDTPKKPKMS